MLSGSHAIQVYSLLGGVKIVVFLGVIFFNDLNDFAVILGHPLGYHFDVKSVKSRCQDGF